MLVRILECSHLSHFLSKICSILQPGFVGVIALPGKQTLSLIFKIGFNIGAYTFQYMPAYKTLYTHVYLPQYLLIMLILSTSRYSVGVYILCVFLNRHDNIELLCYQLAKNNHLKKARRCDLIAKKY